MEGTCVFQNQMIMPEAQIDKLFLSVAGAMPCRARRNTGARQTSVLGVHEPLAYLGAWLAAGMACTSRDEHIAFKPTMVDTQAYAESHGLI